MVPTAVRASTPTVRAAGPEAGRPGRGLAAVTAVALVLGLLSGCTTGVRTGGGPGTSPDPTAAPQQAPSGAPSPTPPAPPATSPAPPATSPAPSATTESPPASAVPPAPTTAPAPVPAAEAPEPPPAPEPAALRRGDEGEAVLALQRRLADLGYFLPEQDGRFGAATQQAVWALQKAAGLSRDGLVGPMTVAAVDAATRPVPRTTTGRAIEVDLDRQLLLAVDDGAVTTVVNASSGNGESYQALGRSQRAVTPRGDYRVVREIDGMHESTLELGAMYRPKYFRGGWAVHGSTSVPPWPASHGCVRVSNAAMDWIWDTWGAPVGTALVVY